MSATLQLSCLLKYFLSALHQIVVLFSLIRHGCGCFMGVGYTLMVIISHKSLKYSSVLRKGNDQGHSVVYLSYDCILIMEMSVLSANSWCSSDCLLGISGGPWLIMQVSKTHGTSDCLGTCQYQVLCCVAWRNLTIDYGKLGGVEL